MFCKNFLVFSLVLMLVVIGFSGCKESIKSKDQIFTQKVFDDCEKSNVKSCLNDAITSRADQYCSAEFLSETDCLKVKIEVVRAAAAHQDKETEEINKKIEAVRKQSAELEAQNAEADRILKK